MTERRKTQHDECCRSALCRCLQRKQLRCGIAVGRLARRKERVAEVVQRLEYLAHVEQSVPAIRQLLQGD